MSAQRLAVAEDVVEPALGATPHWILRIATVAYFIGHGGFEITTKTAWIPYFSAWEMPEPWVWQLMPALGAMEICLGLLTLFRPLPAVLLWMAFWGLETAFLRPLLAGEPIRELLERAGTFGVPLALVWSAGWPRSSREWFSPVRPAPLSAPRAQQMGWILRVTTAALLIGHGGFGAFMHKSEWVGYFATIGVGQGTGIRPSLADVAGWFEVGLGVAILAWPWAGLVLLACALKLGTECLRALAGQPMWEFVAHSGSYAAPLALLWLRGSLGHLDEDRRISGLQHCHRLRALLGIIPQAWDHAEQHVTIDGAYGRPRRRVGLGGQATAVAMLTAGEDDPGTPHRRWRPPPNPPIPIQAMTARNDARLLAVLNALMARRLHRRCRRAVPRQLLAAGDGHRRRRYER